MKPTLLIPPTILYLLLFTSAFPQGSLTPPGAPAPTMKTLDQVEALTPVDSAILQGTRPPSSLSLSPAVITSPEILTSPSRTA